MAYSQTPTLFNSKFHKSQNFKPLKIQVKIPLPHFTNKKIFSLGIRSERQIIPWAFARHCISLKTWL